MIRTLHGHASPSSGSELSSLRDLLETLSRPSFSEEEVSEWAGRLGEIHKAFAMLVARYLEASLAATTKRTPSNPDGEIIIQAAMRLATGDDTLSGVKPARLIKGDKGSE